jgi:hypothetical protein
MTEEAAPAGHVRAGRPPFWFVPRLLGALAAVVASALAFVGTFLALVSGELKFLGRSVMTLSVTGWDVHADAAPGQPIPASSYGAAVQNGYPLAVSGALLFIAAILGVIAAPRMAPRGARSLAVLSSAVAAAFLAGALATVAVQAANLVDTVRPTGTAAGNASFSADAGLGPGFWLELVAALLAIGAAVLAALPVRGPEADLATPRYGFPMPPAQPQ